MIIPDDVPYENAAALPQAWFTVWCNLIKLGTLKTYDTVLIHGGSQGVGIVAVQIAKAFRAKDITTIRNKVKAQALLQKLAQIGPYYILKKTLQKLLCK